MPTFIVAAPINRGAISASFQGLAAELVSRGHRVVLVGDQNVVWRVSANTNPAILTWPSRRPVRVRDLMFFIRLLRAERPACVVANFGATWITMGTSWLLRVPVRIAWYHTMLEAILSTSGATALRHFRIAAHRRLLYPMCTQIVANSRASRDDVVSHFGVDARRVRVFPLGVVDPELTSEARAADIVCPGSLDSNKGQDVLIQAIGMIEKTRPGIRVLFAGEGARKEALQSMASRLGVAENCVFLGSVRHEDLMHLIARSRLVVVPSRSEALGLVAIEALASATPVVVSEVGGLAETVRAGIDGLVVPPGDPQALANAILELYDDEPRRLLMATEGRRRYSDFYELRRVSTRVVDWLENIVSAASPRPTKVTPNVGGDAPAEEY